MLSKVVQISECSRIFSLPMSFFSWLVVFTYASLNSGNIVYGIISLIGISFAHLGTNLIDDYFDYKSLIKQVDFDKSEYLKHSQKTKCRYLINGILKPTQIIIIAVGYFCCALLCGLFLYIKCGTGVLYFSLLGATVSLLYPFLSRICLSEFLVALAYGPILFGGVYYVMCGTITFDIFILSLPTMIMTTVLLYIHTIMDYEYDLEEGKLTIANRFDSQLDSLVILKILLILSYTSLFLTCIFDILDWQILFALLTIPLAKDLYSSMQIFSCNPTELPPKKWYHFPMENIKKLIEQNEASFMVRMYQSRNLMMYFSIILTTAILLSIAF